MMNERIKELSKEAWAWAEQQEYTDPTKEFSDILEKKFAELIVEECCNIFVELRTRPADLAVKDVKKYFGIQE